MDWLTPQLILTTNAPLPNGHYSQAVVARGFVFVAAQLPIVPGTDREIEACVSAQTHQVISNVAAVLAAARSSLDHLVSVSVFVTDMDHWPIVDCIYSARLGSHRPARAVTVSPQLHLGAMVALQAIAVTSDRCTPPTPHAMQR
jgi:2-iminobutanoate/2-iminopropanoate deaminase